MDPIEHEAAFEVHQQQQQQPLSPLTELPEAIDEAEGAGAVQPRTHVAADEGKQKQSDEQNAVQVSGSSAVSTVSESVMVKDIAGDKKSLLADSTNPHYGVNHKHHVNPDPETGSVSSGKSIKSFSVPKPKSCFGSRHVFALLGFLGFAVVYAMRVNLSIAIVDMVRSNGSAHRRGSMTGHNGNFYDDVSNETDSDYCPLDPDAGGQEHEGEFDWDSETKGLILGCFFWGYMVTQIPGGILAERYGGKLLFGIGTFITAIFTLLSPLCARIHPGLFIAARVLEGLGEGVTLPAMHVMLSRWVPPAERSTLGAFVSAGMQFGTVIAMPMSGALAEIELDNGWPFVFYVPGALGVIWFVAWMFFVHDGPDLHPRISEDEKRYILVSTGATQNKDTKPKSISTIPWKSILTSIHLWAILVAHTGQAWGFYMLLTELPTYMDTVLHFNMKANSTLSALPYLAMWIFSNIASVAADTLRAKKVLSTTAVRKVFNSIAFLLPAAALFGAAFTGCDRVATVALITVASGTNGAIYSGFQVNHIDLAKNYAGVMMGITNCVANICGFLAPYIVNLIVTDEGSLSQWRIVFFISTAVYIVSDLFYVIFGTAVEQPWNKMEQDEVDGKDHKNEALEDAESDTNKY